MKFLPSKYQKDVFSFIKNGTGNAVINASAGSGKTTTLLKSLELIPIDKTVLFMAFNKDIATEIAERVPKTNNITVRTVHGFGYSILQDHMKVTIDNNKYRKMFFAITKYLQTGNLEEVKPYNFGKEQFDIIKKMKESVTSEDINLKKFTKEVLLLCNLGRIEMIDELIKSNGLESLKNISDIHSIDNQDGEIECAWYLIKLGIFYSSVIDYTDMIYFPNVFNLTSILYDFVFLDECQDTNTCQRLLMLKATKPEIGRTICVGDEKQAIYGFAGSDYEAYQKLCNLPNTTLLPLSITYRCAEPIVQMVKHLNPLIKSHKSNKEGIIHHEISYKEIQDGDMVLCRQTFPVVVLCIKLLSEGKRAYIVGSDIGLSLITMIKDCERKTEEFNMLNVFTRLYHEKTKMIDKVATNNQISREEAAEDSHVVTYNEKIKVIEVLTGDNTDPLLVIQKIESIFSDEKKIGIKLSNIHKSKGLEAERVFIIHKELMPSKYAVTERQIQQERNLIYVAYTRAKRTLGFVNDFDAWEKHKTFENKVKAPKESKHIGGIGTKMNLKLRVTGLRDINGTYGSTVVYDLVDNDGNVFSKFGKIDSTHLTNDDDSDNVMIGSNVEFRAIIKEHSEFRGVKITKLGKISLY